MARPEQLTIVAFGDSITEGTYSGADVSETWPVLLQYLLRQSGIPVKVLNAGIPGETAPEGLQRFNKQVVHLSPQMVLIMYGANDSSIPWGFKNPIVSVEQFSYSIEQLILLAIQNNITPVLMTTTPISGFFNQGGDGAELQNNLLDEYMMNVKTSAKKYNIQLVDHFRVWMEMDKNTPALGKFLPDGVHPNADGNRLIAQTTYAVLKETFCNE